MIYERRRFCFRWEKVGNNFESIKDWFFFVKKKFGIRMVLFVLFKFLIVLFFLFVNDFDCDEGLCVRR